MIGIKPFITFLYCPFSIYRICRNVTSLSATLSSTLLSKLYPSLSSGLPTLLLKPEWPPGLAWVSHACARLRKLSSAINCDNYKVPKFIPISQHHCPLLPDGHCLKSIATYFAQFFSFSGWQLNPVSVIPFWLKSDIKLIDDNIIYVTLINHNVSRYQNSSQKSTQTKCESLDTFIRSSTKTYPCWHKFFYTSRNWYSNSYKLF